MTATPTRRSVLRGLGLTFLAGAAGFVVARRSDAAKARPVTSAANAYGTTPTGGRGQLLTALDKVPIGGGLVIGGVVLTRDPQGVFGFSSTCTHQGCTVSTVQNGRIECPCHGSAFHAATGAVVRGPASRGLTPVPVIVGNGNVYAE
jgi:Rieske Fe-S protein